MIHTNIRKFAGIRFTPRYTDFCMGRRRLLLCERPASFAQGTGRYHQCSKGSTRAEAWISAETLLTLPAFREKVRKQLSSFNEKSWEVYVNESRTLEQQRPAIVKQATEGVRSGVHLPDYRDEQWETVTAPVTMRKIGKPAYWGFVWLRTKLQIPSATDSIAQLELDIQADGLQVYFNGKLLKAKESDGI